MENKHKLFILGLLLSLCLCGCGKTSDQKSDFEYQLLDGWVENKVDNTLFFTCLLNCYIYFCATSVYNSSTKGSDGCDQIRTV